MICANCKQNEVTGILFDGAGPTDYCDLCKKHCFDIGQLIVDARITDEEVHVVMSALVTAHGEGSHTPDECPGYTRQGELALMRRLLKSHSHIVNDDEYNGLFSLCQVRTHG